MTPSKKYKKPFSSFFIISIFSINKKARISTSYNYLL